MALAKRAESLPYEVRDELLAAVSSGDVPSDIRPYLAVVGAREMFALALIGIAPIALLYAEGRPLSDIAEMLDVPYMTLHSFVSRPDNKPMMDEARAALATDAVDQMVRRARLADDSAAISALKWVAERLSSGAYTPSPDAQPVGASASLSITIDASADALLEKMEARRRVYEASVKKIGATDAVTNTLDVLMGGASSSSDEADDVEFTAMPDSS
jgi:hypothetical protein